MAITVEWDNPERTIALMYVSNDWTWEELFNAINEYKVMIMNSPWEVQLIVNVPEQKFIPPDFLFYARQISKIMPVHSWGGVIVTRSQSLRLILKTLRNIHDPSALRFQVSNSLEDARNRLQQVYATAYQT